MGTDRLPDWSTWRYMPEVKLWEGVALSLNIEPMKIRGGYSWKAEGYVNEESDEFKSRLLLASRSVGSDKPLRPTSPYVGFSDYECASIRLCVFVAWTRKVGWSIPDELAAIQFNGVPSAVDDWEEWTTRPLWTLLQAAYLLAGLEPVNADTVPEHETAASHYADLKDAVDLPAADPNHLQSIRSRTGAFGNKRVRPIDVVRWMRARGKGVPPQLSDLESEPQSVTCEPKPLLTRERETALKLIIGLAVYGLGYDPTASKSPVPGELANELERLGISIHVDTVRKWLQEGAELLPKGTDTPKVSRRKPNSVLP